MAAATLCSPDSEPPPTANTYGRKPGQIWLTRHGTSGWAGAGAPPPGSKRQVFSFCKLHGMTRTSHEKYDSGGHRSLLFPNGMKDITMHNSAKHRAGNA